MRSEKASKKLLLMALGFLLSSMLMVANPGAAQAKGEVLGVHILHPYEVNDVVDMFSVAESDTWRYVTIPLSLDDLKKQAEWQDFFRAARDKKIVPVVRLTSRFENGAWKVPNRKEITDLVDFLSNLEWPTDDRYIIVFNEVNHASEWGGTIDPVAYAETLRFTAQWAHSEGKNFRVLPAAMDLAAPNGSSTREAFSYLEAMLAVDPSIFEVVDVWNSHSYPNPGFSSSPTRTAQNSLRGFEHELAWLKTKTGRELKVMITETGWVATPQTRQWLESYYTYAIQHIWSNPQVLAVTPFLLRGDPGPFRSFSFLDKDNRPTAQYLALQRALEKLQ